MNRSLHLLRRKLRIKMQVLKPKLILIQRDVLLVPSLDLSRKKVDIVYIFIISIVVLVGVYLGVYYTTIMREHNGYFQKKSISDILPDITWEKTYGGSDSDWATSLIQTTDGGYTVAGWIGSEGDGNQDLWIIKLDDR